MKSNTLHGYLYETVKRYPDRTAISYMERDMTYLELSERAGWMREILVKYGVQAGDLVGIYMEKSDLEIAAIFGILSCEAAYIPLDSIYSPVSRIIGILEETKSAVLITSKGGMQKLEAEPEWFEKMPVCRVLVLDGDCAYERNNRDEYVFERGKHSLKVADIGEKGMDSTAYILFTSGSTGKPKGVVLSHRNADAFVDWCCSCFQPAPEDVFLSVAPLHFDLSVFDLYVSIRSGGKLVILPSQKERNVLNYLEYIRRYRVTYLYSVPSLWNAFLRYGKLRIGELDSLKYVLFAGEVFQPEALKKAMEFVPQADFYNLYGLVETNVFTYYKVKGKDSVGEAPVPIGYACGESETVILKDDQEVTRIGEEGELCLCGPLVMKGYYHNQELTDRVIKKSPLERHNGKPLFHTGDIAMLNEEGAYVLIGRRDSLVKKNGFRVELGEIETALASMKGVEEAAAVALKNEKMETILCAAVSMNGEERFSVQRMKEGIAGRIPSYMIPDYICCMEEFKRNSNGKIDREYLKQYFAKQYLKI